MKLSMNLTQLEASPLLRCSTNVAAMQTSTSKVAMQSSDISVTL